MTAPDPRECSATAPRVRVLCVDDEPLVLGGLARTLRPCCDVRTAVGGRAGIAVLAADPEISVVISDLRMPELDGATFLACVRRVAPDAIRIVLTGQADLAGAMAAVNEGQVFRFLLKPIAPALLRSTIEAAAAQHRHFAAERARVEATVPESIAAFVQQLLARAHPTAFGRAMRLKRLVRDIGPRLALAHRWPVEVAAVLSQVGVVALPPPLGERVCGGHVLTPDEQRAAFELPLIAEQLIAGMPRLDSVRYILRHAVHPLPHAPIHPPAVGDPIGDASPREPLDRRAPEPGGDVAGVLGARLLRFALAYDELASRGLSRGSVVDVLARRFLHADDAPVLAAVRDHVQGAADYDGPALASVHAPAADGAEAPHAVTVRLTDVQLGTTFATDVTTDTGLRLVARGQEVTPALLERIQHDWHGFASSYHVRMLDPMLGPASTPALTPALV